MNKGQADFILFISTWRRPGQSWSKRRLGQKVCWCWGRGIWYYINLPQQKTFTYHSALPFLNLQIVCTHIPDCVTSHATIFLQPIITITIIITYYFLTASRWRPPRSGFFPVGESLNIINSIQFNVNIQVTCTGVGWGQYSSLFTNKDGACVITS